MAHDDTAEDTPELREARAALIIAERKRQKLTQRGLAAHAGLSPALIGLIEKSRRPMTEPSMRAIAKALGLSPARIRNPFIELQRAA